MDISVTVCVFVVCTVTDFSADGKASVAWRSDVVVTALVVSTKLLYVEPG